MDCKTFNGVTESIFDCVKKTSESQHGTVYDPPDGDNGTATTDSIAGKVVLTFNLDAGSGALTYCIKEKPWIVSASQIFNGIADTINGCRSS